MVGLVLLAQCVRELLDGDATIPVDVEEFYQASQVLVREVDAAASQKAAQLFTLDEAVTVLVHQFTNVHQRVLVLPGELQDRVQRLLDQIVLGFVNTAAQEHHLIAGTWLLGLPYGLLHASHHVVEELLGVDLVILVLVHEHREELPNLILRQS